MRVFKIISSKTKLDILYLLNRRNYTITEISKYLNKSKSTISEHINELYNFQFVDKINDNHKWKYYYLTNKGKLFLDHLESLKLTFGSGIILLFSYVLYTKFINKNIPIIYPTTNNVNNLDKSVLMEKTNLKVANSYNLINETINNSYNTTTNTIHYTKNIINIDNNLFLIFLGILLIIITYVIIFLIIRKFGKNRTN